jgi:hypothetical protein
VADESRAARGKISSVEKLERVIGGRRTLRVRHPNRLRLDTSDSTAEESFEKIRMHLEDVGARARVLAAVRGKSLATVRAHMAARASAQLHGNAKVR